MRALMFAPAVALVAFAGCSSTYHPDYHPVTVTSYEQHVTNPASGGVGMQAGTVLSAPPPQTPPPPPPWSAWPSE
jgi:hypothetical protein